MTVDVATALAPLEPKQRAFVRQYIVDFNATQAALRAGYSPRSAQQQSSRLLLNHVVSAAVNALANQVHAKAELTVERTKAGIAALSFCDIGDCVDENNNLRPLSEIPPKVRAAIAIYENMQERGPHGRFVRSLKIVLHNKNRALELAGRHLKMFTDKVAVSGTLTLEEAVMAARRRRAQTKGDAS